MDSQIDIFDPNADGEFATIEGLDAPNVLNDENLVHLLE